jgi:AraC-like DNA-binding protein
MALTAFYEHGGQSARSITIEVKQHGATYPHFHKNPELIYVLEGELEMTVDDLTETARAGEFGVILSGQVHAFKNSDPARIWRCQFSAGYLPWFMELMEGKRGDSAKFTCDGETMAYFRGRLLMEHYDAQEEPERYSENAWLEVMRNSLALRGGLYAVCACYVKQVSLVRREHAENSMAYQILDYIAEHFRENITVNGAAEALGYNYAYFSRRCPQLIGDNFKAVVNRYRVEYAKKLMSEQKLTIPEIVFESGFGTVRNFQLVFKSITGKTPSEWK